MVAASMPMLMGFTGLAIDAGTWYRGQQRLQMAADAGALGAARLLTNVSATNAQFQAVAQAEVLAVAATTSGVLNAPVVTVAGDRSNVKVALTSKAPLFFTNFFISGGITLSANATAGPSGGGGSGGGNQASGTCILALAPTTDHAIDVENNGKITAPNCRVFANSSQKIAGNSGKAAVYVRNGTIDATGGSIGAVGGVLADANGSSTITPAGSGGQAAVADPFASVVAPADSSCGSAPTIYNWGTANLSPGTYCGGITLQNGAVANFAPGVYNLLNGNFTITGGASINTAAGVSFYLGGSSPGTIQWTNNATTTYSMSATGSGWLSGILIYQDRKAATATSSMAGGSVLSITGTVYMPKSDLVVDNNAKLTHPSGSGLGVVVNTLKVQGSAVVDAGGTISGTGSQTGNRMIVTQ